MQVIVPMAGCSQRFTDAGYRLPKALINVRDTKGPRRMLLHMLSAFNDPANRFILVCTHEQYLCYGGFFETFAAELNPADPPRITIARITAHTLGPVKTVLEVESEIDDQDEAMIAYCDGTLHDWDRREFSRHVHENALDGCIITHTGFHPHVLASTCMAFLKEENGLVSAVKEKASYTDDPLSEHASSGFYYYRRGDYIKKYFAQSMELGQSHSNGEFYPTLAYNNMIGDNLRVGYFDTPHVAILGTPEEMENFEAWATILRRHQVRSEEDLLCCYRYWQRYHENKATGDTRP